MISDIRECSIAAIELAYNSKELAYNIMQNVNIREGLRIKNRFMVFQDYAIDHINRHPLNCCKSNLCTAGKWTQSINCSVGKNNRLGVVGVY